MSRIIRERYENGILVERTVEGSNFKPWKWLQLGVHLVIATSLAVLAAVAVHDSLTLGSALLQKETSPASCEQSGLRSQVLHSLSPQITIEAAPLHLPVSSNEGCGRLLRSCISPDRAGTTRNLI